MATISRFEYSSEARRAALCPPVRTELGRGGRYFAERDLAVPALWAPSDHFIEVLTKGRAPPWEGKVEALTPRVQPTVGSPMPPGHYQAPGVSAGASEVHWHWIGL